MRPKLPYVDIENFQGLYTKSSPEVLTQGQLRVAENCDYFEVYGAISKIRGNGRVLASIYQENSVTKPITWVAFYKAPDLDGSILRHVLIAAGSTLNRVNSDGTLTCLESGRTENLFHHSAMLGQFMYITNQNPDLVGNGDELLKYDGAVTTKWGLTPPGSEELLLEPFDSAADWTTVNASVADESIVTQDGDAVSVTKTSTTELGFSIERLLDSPFYASSDQRDTSRSAGNRVNFFTYIPRGQLTATSKNLRGGFSYSNERVAMSVYASPDSGTIENNHWRFYIPIGQLLEGWNQLNLDFTQNPRAANLKGQFYPETDRVKRMRWEMEAEFADGTPTGIRFDRLVRLKEGTPIVAPEGSGSFTGAYTYRVVYVSKYGQLSNAGPISASQTASSNSQIRLTNIPISDDPQVIARRIYRTQANGSIHLFLTQLDNNTQTTYIDTTPDGSLGNETAPIAGDFSDDNAPPPKASIVARFKRTIFLAGDPQNPDTLYFSEDDEPESFPLINFFTLDGNITAMYETYSGLVVETETGKWQVIGDNPDFSVDKVIEGMGCVGRRAAGVARVEGWAVDREGMRLFDLNDPKKISEPIRDKYDDLNKPNIELMHTVHSKSRNLIAEFNPDGTTPIPEYDSIFAYQYPIDSVETGYWTEICPNTSANLNFLHATEIEDANGDFRVYAAGDDGMLYELFKEGSRDWVDANGTTYPIKLKFRTPFFRVGELGAESEGVTGRVEPRYLELRTKDLVQPGTESTWKVTVDTADGSSQKVVRDSQTAEFKFGVNNSRLKYAVPPITGGEFIRLQVENEDAATSGTITGIRVYFHVRADEGPVEDVDNSTLADPDC